MAQPPGKLFVLSAPSGAGKTSLAKALVDRNDRIRVAVSHTTRPKRPDEEDGVNYHFITETRFKQIDHQDGFIETAVVFGNYYGTSKKAVDTFINSGNLLILEIDWQGARQIRERMPRAVSIFILPPSLNALRDRLRGRAQDDDKIIARRMAEAINESSHYDEFDFLVVNDDFETAVSQIQAITDNNAPELARERQKSNLVGLLSELLSKNKL